MQHSFVVTDSTLNTSSESAYHLSIQSNLNGLCFCVLDLESSCYVGLQSLPFHTAVVDYNDLQEALRRTLSSEPLLNMKFNSVSCMYCSPNATIVPNNLSDRTLFKQFLDLEAPINELDEVHSYPISSLNATAVYAIPSPLAYKLTEKYGKVQLYNQRIPMLSQLNSLNNQGELLAVNICSEFADIALYIQGELKICNSYMLQSPADLAYFMLAVARQHLVSEKKLKIILGGNIEPYMNEISSFFPNFTLAQPHIQAKISPELLPMADHRFVNLFSLYECA